MKKLITSAVLAAATMASMAASAEVSFNANAASLYLFRGQDASAGAAAVSGGVDYTNKNGAYAGAWTSSGGDTELDLYVGYAGEAGKISYDVSFWNLDYPSTPADDGVNETVIGLGYDNFSLDIVSGEDGYLYTAVGAEFGKVSLTYGMKTDDADDEYSHVDIAYAATSSVTLTASFPSTDSVNHTEEPLYVISYEIPVGK